MVSRVFLELMLILVSSHIFSYRLEDEKFCLIHVM